MRLDHDAVPTSRNAPQATPCVTGGRRVYGLASMVGLSRMFLDPNTPTGGVTQGAAPANQPAPAAPATTQQQGAPSGDLQGVFNGMIQAALAPIVQSVGALTATVGALTAPNVPAVTQQQNPATQQQQHGPNGNQPNPQWQPNRFNVRQGENIMSSRGYQLARLMGVQSGALRSESAKIELDLAQRLRSFYGNSQTDVETQGILVPFASSHIQGFDSSLAVESRQLMNAGVAGADPGQVMQMFQSMAGRYNEAGLNGHWTQSLASWDETSYGAFMSALLQGEIIDLVRPNLVFAAAGAREITMPPNGRLPMGRIVGATSASWIGQDVTNRAPAESKPKFGGWLMVCKKLGVIVTAPNDILRFGSPAFESFIRQDVATTFAHKEEESFIKGLSGLEPRGLINYDLVNDYIASIVGTDGNTFQPADFDNMVAVLEELDLPVGDVTFLMRPKMRAKVKNIRVDAVSGGDGKGVYLSYPDATGMQNGNNSTIQGYRVLKTSNIPKNRSKGSSNVLTMIIAGMFREFLIGRHGVMEVAASDSAGTAFENDLAKWRFLEYVDGGPRREDAFVICDQLIAGYT